VPNVTQLDPTKEYVPNVLKLSSAVNECKPPACHPRPPCVSRWRLRALATITWGLLLESTSRRGGSHSHSNLRRQQQLPAPAGLPGLAPEPALAWRHRAPAFVAPVAMASDGMRIGGDVRQSGEVSTVVGGAGQGARVENAPGEFCSTFWAASVFWVPTAESSSLVSSSAGASLRSFRCPHPSAQRSPPQHPHSENTRPIRRSIRGGRGIIAYTVTRRASTGPDSIFT